MTWHWRTVTRMFENIVRIYKRVTYPFKRVLSMIKVYVTRFWKTDQVVTFSISRNTDFKYWMGCGSPMVQCSHVKLTT